MGQHHHRTSELGHTDFRIFIRRVLLVFLLAGAIVALFFVKRTRSQAAPKAPPAAASSTSSTAGPALVDGSAGPRRLFPYSVIPGGARSKAELATALANDPVAAAHYAGFEVADAHVVHLEHGRSVYVSYRIGEHIYWMSHKLWLPAGEAVLTDGVHEARTRCGNRISEVPQFPVARVEPSRTALDTPVAPDLGAVAEEIPILPFSAVQPAQEFAGTDPVGGHIFIPPIIPFGGGSGTPGGGTPGGTPPGGPPVVSPTPTPEPASLLLLSTGLLGIWISRRKARG
jgi:PEP-CTERM motif